MKVLSVIPIARQEHKTDESFISPLVPDKGMPLFHSFIHPGILSWQQIGDPQIFPLSYAVVGMMLKLDGNLKHVAHV